jgi:hypothetical protein
MSPNTISPSVTFEFSRNIIDIHRLYSITEIDLKPLVTGLGNCSQKRHLGASIYAMTVAI